MYIAEYSTSETEESHDKVILIKDFHIFVQRSDECNINKPMRKAKISR